MRDRTDLVDGSGSCDSIPARRSACWGVDPTRPAGGFPARPPGPRARHQLFGNTDPVDGYPFLPAPPAGRDEIADLMRTCDVFVCSSREEGFGLPGIEAICCGAALVTTDTRGSRDYAVHGTTALVSPPRDPAALARNVISLLGDPEARQRLVAAGQAHAATHHPGPARVGEGFLASVTSLSSLRSALLIAPLEGRAPATRSRRTPTS